MFIADNDHWLLAPIPLSVMILASPRQFKEFYVQVPTECCCGTPGDCAGYAETTAIVKRHEGSPEHVFTNRLQKAFSAWTIGGF
jgi:hypothetical protein